MMGTQSQGIVIRVNPRKSFGFIRIGKIEYFFHKEHYNGDWESLVVESSVHKVAVLCDIVPSDKGPRVENVTKLDI